MFELTQLNLSYGKKRVLSDVTLTIAAGETIAIVGESASGKSTLMSHLYQLNPHEIAWCPQDPRLVPALSAFHNIYAGILNEHSLFYNLRNLIRPYPAEFKKAETIASKLGLENSLKISIEQLSGGQQQRVNIARAMIQKHDVFLGDEPVSALDDYHKKQVIKTITSQFTTCIFALHDLELAMSCCDRIIGLGNGKVIFDEQVSALCRQQLSEVFSHHPVSTLNTVS